MKLLRYGPPGDESPGLLDADGGVRSLRGVVDDVARATLTRASLDRLRALDPAALPQVGAETRLGPCVGSVGKIIAIGRNYAAHAAESGSAPPKEPIFFMKATTAICGPHDDIEIPPGSSRTDWEVELGVVVGERAKRVPEGKALGHVAGYCVVNDVSEREHQLERGGQWVKGKSHDTFAPIGPWLVTADEVPDPQLLQLWLEVDGKRFQDGSTSAMLFGVAHLLSYVSHFMTLEPGDVISTGTPPGVGFGQKPPVYLRPGQELRLGVEGLGEQRHSTVAADS